MTHRSYFNDVLGALYCKDDGEPWPCLVSRQNNPPRCLCAHSQWRHSRNVDHCLSRACGCVEYRAGATA
jgi:hypothetical protein